VEFPFLADDQYSSGTEQQTYPPNPFPGIEKIIDQEYSLLGNRNIGKDIAKLVKIEKPFFPSRRRLDNIWLVERILMIILLRSFIYSSLVFGLSVGLVLAIYSDQIIKAFSYSLLGGAFFGLVMTAYLSFGLFFFKRRWLFYSKLEEQLQKLNIHQVLFESIAGDSTKGRIKYGALFLASDSVIFVPDRFAFNPAPLKVSLQEIKNVGKAGIDILKFFSGGLKKRLKIETTTGDEYQFTVWETDKWIREIDSRIKHNQNR